MPCLPGDDGVELPAGRTPVLEYAHLDVDPSSPRHLGHPGVDLDAEHPATDRLELTGRDTGAGADVEHVEHVSPELPPTIRSIMASG